MGKVLSLDEATGHREKLKKEGTKVVFTNGCFDILHAGHVSCLIEARKLGGALFVGLNSDASVKRLKGSERPIFPESERAEILASLEAVDAVVIFEEDTPLETIKKLVPDILVKGGDWGIGDIVGKDIVEGNGGKVVSLKYIEGSSTSKIIEKIGKK